MLVPDNNVHTKTPLTPPVYSPIANGKVVFWVTPPQTKGRIGQSGRRFGIIGCVLLGSLLKKYREWQRYTAAKASWNVHS